MDFELSSQETLICPPPSSCTIWKAGESIRFAQGGNNAWRNASENVQGSAMYTKPRPSTSSILPVERIAHLNGDQDGQSHGHGDRGLKDLTVQSVKGRVVFCTLHEMGLGEEKKNGGKRN